MSHPSPHSTQKQDALASRLVALQLLKDVLERRLPLDAQFDQRSRPLSPPDRALAMRLTLLGLRYHGALLHWACSFLQTPLAGKNRGAEWLLLLGALQLYAGIPAHAAVDTTLQLAQQQGMPGLKGLLNAVLRKCAQHLENSLPPLLAQHSPLPDWWQQRWQQHYGAETTQAIISASLQPAPLDITLKDPASAPHWLETLAAFQPHLLDAITLRLHKAGAIPELPGYRDGAWWVQDVSSSLSARLFTQLTPASQVLDLCAAPGGKTAQLCATGAQVTALDRSAKRLQRLQQNMQRLGFAPTPIAANALQWQPPHLFDAILLDAPCTASGTLRRHPDMPYLKLPSECTELADLQRQLLQQAWGWLKPGGELVYATCSLEPAEGEEQIQHFLSHQRDAIIQPPTHLPALYHLCQQPEGWLRCLPTHLADIGGMDGFFTVCLRKQP